MGVGVEEDRSGRELGEDALGDLVQDPLRSLEGVHHSSLVGLLQRKTRNDRCSKPH